MAHIQLSQLSAEAQALLKNELGMSEGSEGLIEWQDPRTPARVIVEVWPQDASGGRPAKRYILSRVFWWRDAVAFATQWETDNIHHYVVEAGEAPARCLELELARPSDELLRTGRIWDMQIENCRASERYIDPARAIMPALLAA